MPRLSSKKKAPLQAQLSIRDLLDRAKASIEAGESHMHQAAADVAAAHELGATQCEIAEVVGKNQAWVCGLLKWRRSGWADTPFGPQAKAARARHADYQSTNNREADEADEVPFEQVDILKVVIPEFTPAPVAHKPNSKAALQVIADRADDDKTSDEVEHEAARHFHDRPMQSILVTMLLGVERFTLVGFTHSRKSPQDKHSPLDVPWIEAIEVIGKERFHKLIRRLSAIDADLNSDAQLDTTPAESAEAIREAVS